MAMPYLLQVSMTCWSRMEPPGWTMAVTPLRRARSMLSPKGENASGPRQTPVTWRRDSFFSSAVRGSGRRGEGGLGRVGEVRACQEEGGGVWGGGAHRYEKRRQ